MNPARYACAVFALAVASLAGCSTPPGQPKRDAEILAPSEVLDFALLFSDNCSGCHGVAGRGGPAPPLTDPVYLDISNETEIRGAIANGVAGTSMPAFAESAGGRLTDKQIAVIAGGIRAQWSRKETPDLVNPPAHTSSLSGDAARGAAVYHTYCKSCHGNEGRGGPTGSEITDASYLALVSDQGLRTNIIVGRPEWGAPDWRANIPGKPMSDQEITDVVAWLASHRAKVPGQPYPAGNHE